MNITKVLFCLILINCFSMEFEKFESLVGKHISVVKEQIGEGFVNKLFGKEIYYKDDFSKTKFNGMEYNSFTILTDENEIIKSITVHFQDLINRQFYDSVIKKFGEPNTIKVIDKTQVVSESTNEDDNFSQHLIKRKITLKDGTFEDKPLFIIWKIEQLQIKVLLKHKEKRSEIEFSIFKD